MDAGFDQTAVENLFAEIDTSGSRRITIAKFDLFAVVQTITAVRNEFMKMDAPTSSSSRRGDRQITKKEFVQFFLAQGVSKQASVALWSHADTNENSKINFTEFKTWALEILEAPVLENLLILQ